MTGSMLSEWSRLLFGTLARSGVEDIVISPGSRSTPFAWAALHTPGLRCHSIWDERSAAFFALGQARVSGRPSVLVCTSGSAAAEYFPAVVEASLAFVPLLLLTADRPLELIDCGAAQAMDQRALYGNFARHFVDLGHPEPAPSALDGLVRRIAQSVELSQRPRPGPVQINARARKPLEPVAASSAEERALSEAIERRLTQGPTRIFSAAAPAPAGIGELARRMQEVERGVIVCGPLPTTTDAGALAELARVSGFSLCAETTSQARHWPASSDVVVGAFGPLLASRSPALLEPELVVFFGAPPSSMGFERWFSNTKAAHAVVSEHGWLDPSNRAELIVQGAAAAAAAALTEALRDDPKSANRAARRAHAQRMRRADAIYWRLVAGELPPESALLDEAAAVRTALAAAPDGALLGVGNSLVIRDVDDFAPPEPRSFSVWSQRGVNGIDGLVSGAAGAAKSSCRPSLVLLGDVSLLHDVGGLATARELDAALVLVLIDNGGGRIFEDLPVAKLFDGDPALKSFWLTPPRAEFAHAAKLFGLGYERAETPAALRQAIERAFAQPGCTLVHAVVPPDSARRSRQRLAAALPDALAHGLE
jgi:2-succinyl-5-enolpyruvyl-6-hydroxy-3-cyclohexene-1-carboxylate synthase